MESMFRKEGAFLTAMPNPVPSNWVGIASNSNIMVINKSIQALGISLNLAYDTEALTLSINGTSKNEPNWRGEEDVVCIYQTPLSGVSHEAEAELHVSKDKTIGLELTVAVGDRIGFSILSYVNTYDCSNIGVDVLEGDIQIN